MAIIYGTDVNSPIWCIIILIIAVIDDIIVFIWGIGGAIIGIMATIILFIG